MYKRRLSQRVPPIRYLLSTVLYLFFVPSSLVPSVTGFLVLRNDGIFPTRIWADLSFSGDSKAFLDFEAPVTHVQEWLQTPSASDLHLLGSSEATRSPKDPTLWECKQPRIDFMGLDLQPYFLHRVERRTANIVTVEVVDSRTEILNPNNPANQLVGSLMTRAKFSGASRIQARGKDRKCQLLVDLTLTLHVPLPPFVLLPPGFNTVGSTIVTMAGKGRTEQLVQELKAAYLEWSAMSESTSKGMTPNREMEK